MKPKSRRRRRWVLWCLSLLILFGGAFAAAVILAAKPPVQAFAEAGEALSRARRDEAPRYASALFSAAEKKWKQANQIWQRENQDWFLARDFAAAASYAFETARLADSASVRSTAIRDSLRQVAMLGIPLVKEQIEQFKPEFDNLPLSRAVRQEFGAGQMLIMESELAFNRRDYIIAVSKLQEAARDISSSGARVGNMLEDYLANLPIWQRWVRETVNWSGQNGAAAIIVDKLAHSCQIYVAGKLQHEFPVELGPRWLGHKRSEGDKATPEGRYFVKRKKSQGSTKYHKALEIDYPNQRDRETFAEAKRRGQIPSGARIGGLIEIHGEGGRGVNWTSGCVALRNDHMDKVFALASIGTPVTIVGSLSGRTSRNGSALELSRKGLSGAANLSALARSPSGK